MIEIKIQLEEIDYANVAAFAFPILKAEAQKSTALWATVVKNMGTPDESTINNVLKLLPQSIKDKIAVKMLEKYKDDIPNMLTSFAESKGISVKVADVDISC